MNWQVNTSTIKTLATGLIVSGVILTSLATTGCDTQLAEQVAYQATGSPEIPIDLTAVKPDPAGRLSANHNETFRVATEA